MGHTYMRYFRNNWRGGGLFILAMAATALLVWWLNEPVAALLRAASSVRDWLVGLGPLAPVAYVLFYATQILLAPLPGNFLSIFAGYTFGFVNGLLLSLAGLTLGATLAVLIARHLGRPLLERFFDRADLIRWERKLRLRSPMVWYVFFLFPVPDLVIYAAGLGTLRLSLLLPAILLGRATSILFGIAMGNATAILPAQLVVLQWCLLVMLAGFTYKFQRPMRYFLLVGIRRLQRSSRLVYRSVFRVPVGTPIE